MKTKIVPTLTITLGLTLMTSCNSPKTNSETQITTTVADTVSTQKGSKKPFTSSHIFTAKYEGTSFHKCLGRTIDCPEKCGESGNLATFNVIDYEVFDVNGQGGTEKLSKFELLISDYNKNDLDKPYVSEIKNLKKGDDVIIHVEYVYDTTLPVVQTVVNVISISKSANQ